MAGQGGPLHLYTKTKRKWWAGSTVGTDWKSFYIICTLIFVGFILCGFHTFVDFMILNSQKLDTMVFKYPCISTNVC